MRKQFLAAAMAVALAAMLTPAAMALSQNSNRHGVRGNHAGIHGTHGRHGGRTIRGYGGHGDSGRGPNFIGLGISGMGFGFNTGEYGCSPTDKAYIGGFCGDYVPY